MKNLKVYQEMLIVVDMVNGFVNEGVLHDEKIKDIVPRQLQLIKKAFAEDWLVVFIKDTHTKDSTEFRRFGNTNHCLEKTREAKLIPELEEFEHRGISIEKNSTSFFVAPGFQNLIDEATSLKRIHVMGCCTDICVANGVLPMMNYFDQNNRVVDVLIHEDAIETYDSPQHPRAVYSKAAKLLLKQQGAKFTKKFSLCY